MKKIQSEYNNSDSYMVSSVGGLDTASERSHEDDRAISKHIHHFYNNVNSTFTDISEKEPAWHKTQIQEVQPHTPTHTLSPRYCCKICNNVHKPGSFIILSCDHIFHVQCLAEESFKDLYKHTMMDGDFLATQYCSLCHQQIQKEELLFLHSKYLKCTEEKAHSHHSKIGALEEKLAKLKEELRVCYEYRHKLDGDREKSKQLVSTLMTLV